MSVGVLIITHGGIGACLLETATRMFGGCPLQARTLAVVQESERDALVEEAYRLAETVDTGGGVLVLTDLFGSTPANVARALMDLPRVRVLAGINLPMLVRVLNYAALPLDEMAAKAESGGREGVVLCPQDGPQPGTAS
jgi:PTS system ascorbate-specific IIA component